MTRNEESLRWFGRGIKSCRKRETWRRRGKIDWNEHKKRLFKINWESYIRCNRVILPPFQRIMQGWVENRLATVMGAEELCLGIISKEMVRKGLTDQKIADWKEKGLCRVLDPEWEQYNLQQNIFTIHSEREARAKSWQHQFLQIKLPYSQDQESNRPALAALEAIRTKPVIRVLQTMLNLKRLRSLYC